MQPSGLGVETGEWRGLRREERVCKNCGGGVVEDVGHVVMSLYMCGRDLKTLRG